ncbi:hypothetical protein LUZ60_006230 [Juncus effusus]|nr:hypothetical protein LUZ60_006230 [Juncus effusus]
MAAHWLSDMDCDHEASFFHQWRGDTLDHLTEQQIAVAFGLNQNQELHKSISSESNTINTNSNKLFAPQNTTERPKKDLKTNSWDSCITEQTSSSPTILSFGTQEAAPNVQTGFYGSFVGGVKPKEEVDAALNSSKGNCMTNNKRGYDAMINGGDQAAKKGGNYTSSNQDHILAERKRREKLSQRFIALSKIVPGLKKMDKASVLGDAIKYLKTLQEKVETLETQATKKTVESAIIVNKSRLSSEEDEESNSSSDNFNNNHNCASNGLPEIEAKMSDKSVLIKIHCENKKGILVKALNEIEQLGLSIVSTNVIPFAGSSLDITAMAQVEEEFSLNVKDIVKKLNLALKQLK